MIFLANFVMIRGIILAGGSGKRLWPVSRTNNPKQLLKLFSDKTLIEESIDRLQPIVDSVYVSLGKNIESKTREVLPKTNFIVEPLMRDTAPAIGLCATKFDENDILVFTPSDAYITPTEKFQSTIKKAILVAKEKGCIVTIGIKPDRAADCYGYLEPDENKLGKVKSFREKPSVDVAAKYVKKGFLWNAGIFVCKAGVLLELFKKHSPNIYSFLVEIKNGANVEDIYSKMEKISFDFAVMEKTSEVYFVPAQFYWNDVGGFEAIHQILNQSNSSINCKIIDFESKGNLAYSDSKKTIALIDCEDLIVVDTKDVVFVCKKSSANKIKKFVEEKVNDELK
jgi:mannose-1-phosphate guanylyltransferase